MVLVWLIGLLKSTGSNQQTSHRETTSQTVTVMMVLSPDPVSRFCKIPSCCSDSMTKNRFAVKGDQRTRRGSCRTAAQKAGAKRGAAKRRKRWSMVRLRLLTSCRVWRDWQPPKPKEILSYSVLRLVASTETRDIWGQTHKICQSTNWHGRLHVPITLC